MTVHAKDKSVDVKLKKLIKNDEVTDVVLFGAGHEDFAPDMATKYRW